MRLAALYHKFLENTATAAELKEFWGLLSKATENDPFWKEVYNTYYHGGTGNTSHGWELAERRLFARKKHKMFALNRWVVAACLLLFICAGLFLTRYKSDITVAKQQTVLAPFTNKASITLADGSRVYLENADTGHLALEGGNINLVKRRDGQIVYQAAPGARTKALQYNTLTNPGGSSVINMQLSDGSRVWLNAGSSITYPVAFADKERKVEISGEAYFEVTHNSRQPFIVTRRDAMNVRVLGTKFNVNAYGDEPDIKVTLLEGSVKVAANVPDALPEVLKKGEQAVIAPDKEIVKRDDIDVDAVMAWKQGFFSFDNMDLRSVMKQIARWYNVGVLYKGNVRNKQFIGKIPREVDLQTILKILAASNIHCEFKGNEIIVTP
ncbi:MAG: FecR domain-containing protein [Niabella sp.]